MIVHSRQRPIAITGLSRDPRPWIAFDGPELEPASWARRPGEPSAYELTAALEGVVGFEVTTPYFVSPSPGSPHLVPELAHYEIAGGEVVASTPERLRERLCPPADRLMAELRAATEAADWRSAHAIAQWVPGSRPELAERVAAYLQGKRRGALRLPKLAGSPKQIAWAERIRAEATAALTRRLGELLPGIEGALAEGEAGEERALDLAFDACVAWAVLGQIRARTEAAWHIDTRKGSFFDGGLPSPRTTKVLGGGDRDEFRRLVRAVGYDGGLSHGALRSIYAALGAEPPERLSGAPGEEPGAHAQRRGHAPAPKEADDGR